MGSKGLGTGDCGGGSWALGRGRLGGGAQETLKGTKILGTVVDTGEGVNP